MSVENSNEDGRKERKTISHSKKWKEYLIEFIMLFLAISLGFLADNYREKISEKVKERDYIHSMIEDVQEDRLNIKGVVESNTKRSKFLDSLGYLCMNYIPSKSNGFELYKYFPIVLYRPDFIAPTELTMQQLKNAGGMRLIKNKNSINAIIRYDSRTKKIANQQTYYENYHNNSINLGTKIFNIQKIIHVSQNKKDGYKAEDFKLMNYDRIRLNEFGNTVSMYKGIVDYYIYLLEEMDSQADALIRTLKDEYELK